MISFSGRVHPGESYSKLTAESSVTYYQSKDPFLQENLTYAGYGINMTFEQNNPTLERNMVFWWRLNGNAGYAGQEDYGYNYYTDEKFAFAGAGLDLSIKFNLSADNYLGILGGYTYEYAGHRGYYEQLFDQNNDGIYDTLYYTGSDYQHSVNDNKFRFGINLDIGQFNLKAFYCQNINHNDNSGPGLEVSWTRYNFVPYGKIRSNKEFNKILEFDTGFSFHFFNIGYRSTQYGNNKIPKLNQAYLGATISFK